MLVLPERKRTKKGAIGVETKGVSMVLIEPGDSRFQSVMVTTRWR